MNAKIFLSRLSFLLLVICALQPAAIIIPQQGYVRAIGSRIYDGNNQELIFKGIGLGGWLVPEGYMLLTADFANSPTEIKNKIQALIGAQKTDEFYAKYRANFVTRKDIEQIAAWGFNSVRLPMHYDLLTPRNQPFVYTESGFVLIDSLLQQCEDNHIYLILDLHCAPGGQNSGNISDYDPAYPSLWQDTLNQRRTVELWKKLAERYANKKWIGGYDLLNETNWDLGSSNWALRDLSIRITNAIRSVDNNHLIFIEGNAYATNFAGLSPAWDINMAYSFHKYWNETTPGSISQYIDLRNNTSRPLWLGESGENNNKWFTECISLMQSNNIGWAWWTLKKVESVSGLCFVKKPAEYETLLKYWKGQAAQPTVDYAVNALNKLANNLLLQNCRVNEDVIDALIRQPASNETLPFKNLEIPGIIYAPDYDMGKSGFAYKDSDDGNSGSQYRNNSVDIESSTDAFGNGYDVGWINANEFLKYTVNVSQQGYYAMDIRYAANAAGGKIQLYVDGQPEGSLITLPSTGGWTSWSTYTIPSVRLTQGRHNLILNFLAGGFNLSLYEFSFIADAEKEDPAIKTFTLAQNYPNPFNPSTVISYETATQGRVKLTVYDALGRLAATLVDGEKQAGKYTAEWNPINMNAGVYFYELRSGTARAVKKMLLLK